MSVTCAIAAKPTLNLAVVVGETVYVLDLAARVDETAEFMCRDTWKILEFPPPFGRGLTAEVGSVER